MVYRHISADMKQRALQLIELGWDTHEIAAILGVSEKSIGRWEDNYATSGVVNPKSPLRGRPRILNTEIVDELRQLIEETPSLFLDEISEWLALMHDTRISVSALQDNLQDLALTRKVMRRAAAERDDAHRAEWILNVTTNYRPEQILFLDESSKDDRTLIRKYGRAPSGEDPVLHASLQRGVCYSILPALTLKGYIALRVVEGSVDGSEFVDFVIQDVVSTHLDLKPIP